MTLACIMPGLVMIVFIVSAFGLVALVVWTER